MSTITNISISLGSSKAGLSLQAQLAIAGVDSGARITTGFVDRGGGEYVLPTLTVADDFVDGTLDIFNATDTTPLASGRVVAKSPASIAAGDIATDAITAAALAADAKAEIADAVMDEPVADHNTEGSYGNVINDLTEESGGVYRLTAVALGTAPTGSTATYSVSTTTVGAAPTVNIVAYQYAAFGPYTITASAAQTGDSHSFLAYNPNAPATVLWSLTTAGGEISVGGSGDLTITLTDTDAHMSTAGVFAYVLRNTTDDTVICEGSLTIEERPNVPA